MPPVRKPKPPVAAWIVENRKRLGWKSEELAARLDVSDSTVRGWESGRAVSSDNLAALERAFGVTAPGGSGDRGDDVAAAIDRQTAVLRELVSELQAMRGEQAGTAEAQMSALALIAQALGGRLPEGTGAEAAQPSRGASVR